MLLGVLSLRPGAYSHCSDVVDIVEFERDVIIISVVVVIFVAVVVLFLLLLQFLAARSWYRLLVIW